MNGIIIIDKPRDMTSAQVVARVKRISKARKVGHTGTLDPFATGVLVCCINKATRLAQCLVYGQKRYKGVMRLGIRTDTQDFTGRVVSQEPDLTVTREGVHRAFRGFLGVTYQNPPAYSALKHNGVPLYKLARQGTVIQKPARPISIYGLEVVDVSLPDVRFEVCCSGGTYVRTLCADIGEALGCGAHLTELCRTETGKFSLEEAISLEALAEVAARGAISEHVVPMNVALRGMPCISGDDELVQKIQLGRPVTEREVTPVAAEAWPWIKVTDDAGNLVAVMHSNKKNGVYPYACVFQRPES
ncbi:MAG: tRNA pseudouridine(55) synthase TruB [Deltaproteobacteria bacterium]|nr:tRNA pseudouridine(55) synthase TruB [Deltaproteobacteria bacterium]MBW2259325.1 tRNA pseudouridine(55) synthase TruB [Deltaproteobacteria bacterium]